MDKDQMVLFCDLMLCRVEKKIDAMKDETTKEPVVSAYMEMCEVLTQIDLDEDDCTSSELIELKDDLYEMLTAMKDYPVRGEN